jgi:hypothetical protein
MCGSPYHMLPLCTTNKMPCINCAANRTFRRNAESSRLTIATGFPSCERLIMIRMPTTGHVDVTQFKATSIYVLESHIVADTRSRKPNYNGRKCTATGCSIAGGGQRFIDACQKKTWEERAAELLPGDTCLLLKHSRSGPSRKAANLKLRL